VQHNHYLLTHLTYFLLLHYLGKYVKCIMMHVSIKHKAYCCTVYKRNKFNCTTKRVQVQLLQQMFEMSSFLLNAGPKSIPPFVDSIITDTLQQSVPCISQALLQIGHVSNWCPINTILHKHPIFDGLVDSLFDRSGLFGGHKSGAMNLGVSRKRSSTL